MTSTINRSQSSEQEANLNKTWKEAKEIVAEAKSSGSKILRASKTKEEDPNKGRKYVKVRSDLFQTYAVIAAFFSSIGMTVYYDSVAEEWIPIRDAYLQEHGDYSVNRTAIEMSKVLACAGVLISLTTMILIVIGLVFMSRLGHTDATYDFMQSTQIWFFGWSCWDETLARIANSCLSTSLLCFLLASIFDVYNRVDSPYTYITGFAAIPLGFYIIYFMWSTKQSWDLGFKQESNLIACTVELLDFNADAFKDEEAEGEPNASRVE